LIIFSLILTGGTMRLSLCYMDLHTSITRSYMKARRTRECSDKGVLRPVSFLRYHFDNSSLRWQSKHSLLIARVSKGLIVTLTATTIVCLLKSLHTFSFTSLQQLGMNVVSADEASSPPPKFADPGDMRPSKPQYSRGRYLYPVLSWQMHSSAVSATCLSR
jgi:hypothetical protein